MTGRKIQKLEEKEDLKLLMPKDRVIIEDFGEMCLVEKSDKTSYFVKRERGRLILLSADIYSQQTKIVDNKLMFKGPYIHAINENNDDYKKYNNFLIEAGA